MPQLNPEFFLSQVFWLTVSFVFLLLFLWKISLPRIQNALERRENKVNKDLEEAKNFQTEAENLQKHIDEEIHKAKTQAQENMKNSLDVFKKNAEKEISLLDNSLEKKISESSLTIQNSKEDALKNISVEVSQLTALAAEKLTNMKIDEKQLNEEINKIDFNSKDLN
tara:strand:- start:315 stop:815 length:501 start_codon:yes stop_codon:yes gene_type:complete